MTELRVYDDNGRAKSYPDVTESTSTLSDGRKRVDWRAGNKLRASLIYPVPVVPPVVVPPVDPPVVPPVVPPVGDYQTLLRSTLVKQMSMNHEIDIAMYDYLAQHDSAEKRGTISTHEAVWDTSFGAVGQPIPVPFLQSFMQLHAYEGGRWRKVESDLSPGVTGDWGDWFLSADTVTLVSPPQGAYIKALPDDSATELKLVNSTVCHHGSAGAREPIYNPTCMIAAVVIWAPTLPDGVRSGCGTSVGMDATAGAVSGGVGSSFYRGDSGIGPVIEVKKDKRVALCYWGTLPSTLPVLDGVDATILSRS